MKKDKINLTLRNEVLSIVDKLYKRIPYFELFRDGNKFSLPLIESLSSAYAEMNCGNHFAFKNILLPHLRLLSENQRLSTIKDLLTVGYVDIGNKRVFMHGLPYLNGTKDEPMFPYVIDIPVN